MKHPRWPRFALTALALLVLLHPQASFSKSAESPESDAEFDRLDGKGTSGKRVDVIEWEGNLEIHVYPAGSLKGLALKLDQRNKDKPVMVIGYRFDNAPSKQLIRRAVLGIPLAEPLKVFRDPSEEEFDKIVISNNGLGAPLALFKLDAEPKQLYPDGHPALAQNEGDSPKSYPVVKPKELRKPASRDEGDSPSESGAAEIQPDDGTIQPFFTSPESRNRYQGRKGW